MKLKHQTHSSLLFQFRALATLLTMGSLSSFVAAQSGTWSATTTPATWSDTGNWASGAVATGSGNTANFTNDIAADTTINITADQTIGSIIFGDSNTSTAGSWTIANNGTATNNLIFAGTTPTITVNALGATKTATISAIIEGTAGLTKSGSGTLVLSALNTFTGGFTINEGRVNFVLNNTASSLGAGNVTIGGSTNTVVDNSGNNASLTSVTGWTLTGSGTVTRSNSSGSGIGWGTAKITGSSGGLIYTSASAGAVIQVGAVTSDYTGGTTLTSGTIVMNGTNNGDTATAGTFGNGSVASNVVTLNGASIRGGTSTATRTIFNNISFTADTTLAATAGGNAGTLTWGGEVTLNGTGSVRKLTQASATQDTVFSNTIKNGSVSDFTVDFTGSRSVSLGAANTFSGTMLVTGTGGGGLALAHVNALQNATLDTGSATASRAVTFTAAGTNTYNIGALQGADDLAIGANTLSVGAKAVDTSFSGAISGTGGLTKVGTNALTLSGSNSYTGTTTIANGTVSASNIVVNAGASQLGNATSAVTLGAASTQGVLSYTGNSATFTRGFTIGGAGGGRLNVTTAGQTLQVNTGAVTGSGLFTVGGAGNTTINSNLTHSGGLTKTDAGTLTLTGANNTYSGATTVSAGTLVINGNITSNVTVSSGATIGGSGTVGALTINAGGTVAPGNSPGTLNTGNYNQVGTLVAEITGLAAGTEHDQINVTGTVNLSGALDLQFSASQDYVFNSMIFLILNDEDDAVTGAFTGLAQGATAATFGGFDWVISYTANSTDTTFTGGNDVALMAIPEPSAALLGGLGVLGLLRRRRK
jgi:fibronectin-binding autotransporter adhesin